jgi:Protein of unknown function (DUF2934)
MSGGNIKQSAKRICRRSSWRKLQPTATLTKEALGSALRRGGGRAIMSHDKENKIRAVAHRIWEEAGKPSDQAELHWEMATKEVEEQELAAQSLLKEAREPSVLKNRPLV